MLLISLMVMSMSSQLTAELPARVREAPAYHYIMFDLDSTLAELYSGFQNIEENLPSTQQTSFRAFSITKTFTSVAIMQLVEKGALRLDDPVDKYLPDYRFSEAVSIQQLLSHQSGLANPIPLKWTHLREDHANHNFKGFADSVIMSNLKLKRPPGSKFSYSNLNYLILGRLIEEISGLSYENYVSKHILLPLKIEDQTGFKHPDTNQARGYNKNNLFQRLLLGALLDKKKVTYPANKDWIGFHPFYLNGSSYGGLFTTAEGLMNFGRSLLSDKRMILESGSISEMFSDQVTNTGNSTGMGLGWFNGKLHDMNYFCHAGGGGGYYAELRLYPGLGVGSIVMLNSSGMKDYRLLDKLDAPYIKRMKNDPQVESNI